VDRIREFLKLESASGALLVLAAALAVLLANSPLESAYTRVFSLELTVALEDLAISKPLLLWINDGLMAVFFFLIGLEVKRELLEGELRSREQVLLPGVAALGGFVVPAALFAAINRADANALAGWAIPSATDIAFALGTLSLLGDRVPLSLKVFLTSLAIFDDIAAIVVIAIFYTMDLSLASLVLATLGYLALLVLNRTGVQRVAPYLLIGIFIWVCVLKSGVHATLAGFVVAFAIPMRSADEAYEGSPLRHLEHVLHPWVAFMILPIFAFANAGVSFAGLSVDDLAGGMSVGIFVGLFVGKQLGVMLGVAAVCATGLARLPAGVGWRATYGVALLTGIGFTMSLFIGTLAFEHSGIDYGAQIRVAVLTASMLSAALGLWVLHSALPRGGTG